MIWWFSVLIDSSSRLLKAASRVTSGVFPHRYNCAPLHQKEKEANGEEECETERDREDACREMVRQVVRQERHRQTQWQTEWQCWIHNLLSWNKHDKNDVNMSITILSLPHILLHPPNLWKHCGGVPPHVIHHNVYKVSMYSIIHETFMTFNSPCCCARSLVSVKTLSSWYKDKCVGVCSCSPARHIYFFFFRYPIPPTLLESSQSLSFSEWQIEFSDSLSRNPT